jgi:aryl-alcohol dehydrogenase-like predicted oxidoreductase
MNESNPDLIRLGASDVMVSPLGIGTNTWGSFRKPDPGLASTFTAALDLGINFFDTAEIYQLNGSEMTLGQFLPGAAGKAVIETKIFPLPWRVSAKSLLPVLRASLKRLNLERVDVYMIHFPLPPVPIEAWMGAFADAVEAGLVRTVGVSNYNSEQVKRACDALAKRGIKLAVNQMEYNLLRRGIERDGLLALCKELNICLIAYRPLASGLLTGKYTLDTPLPTGRRSMIYNRAEIARALPVVMLLRQMGEAHGGKTPGQVALNWLICKGTLPIPGAKNVKQVQSNAGALGWRLNDDEIAMLDATKAA